MLHLVGYLYYWQMGFNSVFKGLRGMCSTLPVWVACQSLNHSAVTHVLTVTCRQVGSKLYSLTALNILTLTPSPYCVFYCKVLFLKHYYRTNIRKHNMEGQNMWKNLS